MADSVRATETLVETLPGEQAHDTGSTRRRSPELADGARDSPLLAGRYLRQRTLGSGSMGTVYLVDDRETGERLAFKRLFQVDGQTILRLKREFRALADISHPNLAKVYELGTDPEGWFLTMEYVPGEELDACLARMPSWPAPADAADGTLERVAARMQRVRDVFGQLAVGVHALHEAGLLHRDLKPSNVLVSQGRVVVLDFGLVRELSDNAPRLSDEGALAGTPAYMAPEQAHGQALSKASDWYAFGVMLYEVLAHELPFEGTAFEMLQQKVSREARPLRDLDPGLPEDLQALCMELLARDPAKRPSGEAICVRLARAHSESEEVTLLSSEADESSLYNDGRVLDQRCFFGRQQELEQLTQAVEEADEGAAVVHVRGLSGAGKSALVEHFFEQVEQGSSYPGAPAVLLLRGRCYEREEMPFKALDSVVDALGRHLSCMPDVEVSNLLPADIEVLAQLFPVLGHLRVVQQLLSLRCVRGAAAHSRDRAEHALRELFKGLTRRSPVVVWIDDLQWGDLDSARILKGWLQNAADLPLMLVLSYRRDEALTSECLKQLLSEDGSRNTTPARIIDLDSLADDDLESLCAHRLGSVARGRQALVDRIVRESAGSPFLVTQLTSLAETRIARGDPDLDTISIPDLIQQSSAILDEEARRLLAVVAIAGRPIAPKLAMRAAGVGRGGREHLHNLRRLRLIRMRDMGTERLVEFYHDRVREGVQRLFTEEQRIQVHRSLLSTLEYRGRAEPEWLCSLALGAAEPAAALRYGMVAASRASSMLAFERAAELYGRCLELSEELGTTDGDLVMKLASARDLCGRGSEAADLYLKAADLATGSEASHLYRLAGSHLLRSGRFADGEAMLQRVLTQMGLGLPQSPRALRSAIAWTRMKRRFRGLAYRSTDEAELAPAQLGRIDTLISLAQETSPIDPSRAASFRETALQLALDAGEPKRVHRALCSVAYGASMDPSRRGQRQAKLLIAKVTSVAQELDTPRAWAATYLLRALCCANTGRFRESLEPAAEAIRIYRALPEGDKDGSYYERVIGGGVRLSALYELGEVPSFLRELRALVRECERTGNVAGRLRLATSQARGNEIEGSAQLAVERLKKQQELLPRRGCGSYHAYHVLSVCIAARASGQTAWGMQQLDERWPALARSALFARAGLRTSLLRERWHLLLSHLSFGRGSGDILATVRRELNSYSGPEALAVSLRYEIGPRLALIDGDRQGARALLEHSIERARNPFAAARQRLALGQLIDGEQGQDLRQKAEHELEQQMVADTGSYLRGCYPELFHES